MFCEQLKARNQQWIHFFFPGVWDIHWIWGWEDIDWVLNKHRTVETIKLVINLLLLIPPASWWNLSKLTAGWIRTVIKHDVNCWALKLYYIYIYIIYYGTVEEITACLEFSLQNVPNVHLLHEALVDQLKLSKCLAWKLHMLKLFKKLSMKQEDYY